ncbi:MAG: hypothetical protein HY063_04975 [Bacteroidetes bacterium]|nr:hypothetical protein [Bacteroidota bacterium]
MDANVIHLLKILEVALIASVKFVVAPFEAERQGFNFREAFFISTGGGFIGILVFTFIGEVIAYGWRKIINFFRKPLGKEDKPRKKFTWLNKFIIRTKMRFGEFGLVITTPLIISIPIGTFMVHRFYRKKGRNIFLLMLSVLFWSVIINGLAQYLKLSQYIPK